LRVLRKILTFLGLSILSQSFLFSTSFPLHSENREVEDVVVLGAGVGGLTSALYLARAHFHPLVIEGNNPGGALAQSPSVQNWPGEVDISGPNLIEKLRKQVLLSGARLSQEEVVSIDLKHYPFTMELRSTTDLNHVRRIQTKSCIIALGAQPKFLGIPGEKEYWTKGVYNCATCDGGLFDQKIVAVIGGGDGAVVEAHHLSKIAKKVYVLVRGKALKSKDQALTTSLLQRPNVELRLETKVQEIQGNGKALTHLELESKGKREKLTVDGLFIAIGSDPNTALFRNQLTLDEKNYIYLKEGQETSVQWVYAVGDIADAHYRQATTAAGSGSIAALQLEKKWAQQKKDPVPFRQAFKEELPVLQSAIIEIQTQAEFLQALQKSQKPVLIDFYASWCNPCRQFLTKLQEWEKRYGKDVQFFKIDIDKFPQLAQKYEVTSVPTIILFNRLQPIFRGGASLEKQKEAEAILNDFLAPAP
jgi:thioredoxin reductase (NADPH)